MTQFKLSAKQQTFLSAVNRGDNIFLTGKAGTGKSHVTAIVSRVKGPSGLTIITP